jgi:hypothetical protein
MQETSLNRAARLRPIVIEVAGEPQGIVVPETDGFKFLAVKLPAFAMDGHRFPSVEHAHQAVSRAVSGNIA